MSRLNIGSFFVAVALALPVFAPVVHAQGQSSVLIEEVIVTARKREESLQDIPLAVSAFSGEALDFRGVTTIDKLYQFTPNLTLATSPSFSAVSSNAAIYIRGIGQNDFVPVIDPGVGIYVDGVYLGRSVGAVLDIVDVERVEILRGPQGTLFGRNTIGGAITVTSVKPQEEFAGQVGAKIGTDDRTDVHAMLNVPLTENLFSRFNVASFNQDGYVTRVADGIDLGDDDTIATRAAFRWLPSEKVAVDVLVDYSRDRENGPASVLTGIQPINFDLATNPLGAPSMVVAANTIAAQLAIDPGALDTGGGEFFDVLQPFPFQFLACFEPQNANNPFCINEQWIDGSKKHNYGTDPAYADLDVWGAAATLEWEINESLTLKSITSHREFDGDFSGDEDATPVRGALLIDSYEQDQFSQELQLLGSSFDDRLQWIVGAFYFEEDGFNINPVRFSQVDLQSGGHFDADSWAIFSQGTWSFTEKLELTLGGRYTEDTRKYLPDQFFEGFPIGPLPIECFGADAPTCEVGDRVLPFEEVETDTDEFVPMINLSYRLSDDLLTYFTYSEGFKSGGFTQRIFPPEESLPSFGPETVESYEIGSKFEGWDNRLRLNAAAFFTDYQDLQLSVADPTRVGPFVTNAGDAEILGLELEAFLSLPGEWFISASLGLLDLDRTRLGTGNQTIVGLTLDSRFEQISDTTANLQIYKEIPIGDWGYLTPRVEWAFRSEYGSNRSNIPRDGPSVVGTANPFADANGTLGHGVPNPALVGDDLHLINVSVRWDPREAIAVTAGVDNLTDEEYPVNGTYEDSFGWTAEIFDRGIEWYLEATYDF
jgi:iron complex outermembrane receptor protein